MAYTRSIKDVGVSLLKYTNFDQKTSSFAELPVEQILKKQVVVATLTTVGKLVNAGVPRGHFDVVIVDEAGQALEPETIAAPAGLLGKGGQLVLGGDPRQLGPIIHSSLAKEYGLACSLLERLMERCVYGQQPGDGYDSNVLTKLVRNYRAHPVLLELPNQLFYGGELQCCADPGLRDACINWEELPTPGVPLFFSGMVGKDTREGSSPSWFNPDEVVAVVKLVQQLLKPRAMGRGGMPLKAEHIGVITPYNKQVQRMRDRLVKANLSAVKVGSTELFQGQERRVIIITTVRSSEDYVGFDVRHQLGFLDNPKRFNVAITRAQSLLVVVGNPLVLMLDPHWRALIRLCVAKGAYRGVALPPETTDDEASAVLIREVERLTLDTDEASHAMQQEHMEMPSFE